MHWASFEISDAPKEVHSPDWHHILGPIDPGFKEEDLPTVNVKRKMYETGKQMLAGAGYVEIGMDHFALKSDSLYKAVENKKLHRNFMGYTSSKTKVMIGLGVSAISDSWTGFAQNVKTIEEYQRSKPETQLFSMTV